METKVKRNIFYLLLVGIVLPVLGSLLSSFFLKEFRFDDTTLHSIVETIGALIAIFTSVYIFQTLRNKQSKIAHVYFWFSVTLLIQGSYGFVDAYITSHYFIWFHSISAILGGIAISFIWILPRFPRFRSYRFVFIFIAFIQILFISLFRFHQIQIDFNPNQHKILIRTLNLIGSLGFFSSSVYFFKRYIRTSERIFLILTLHGLLIGCSGILYCISEAWSMLWWWWHILRLLAYFILFQFFYILQNIQFQKQYEKTQQALIESKEKYKNLFLTMNDGVAYLKPIYNKNGKMIDSIYLGMNSAYEAFINYNRKDAIAKSVLELMPNTEQEWFEIFDEVVKTGESTHFEMFHEHTGRYYSVSAYRPKPNTYASIFKDITVKKLAEENTKKALEKEREFNLLKSNFTTMTSHQFKTPLSNIKTSIELLEFKAQNLDPKNQEYFFKHFQSIHEEIEIMNLLIEDILTFGKIEQKHIILKKEPTSVIDLCKFLITHRFNNKLFHQNIQLQIYGNQQDLMLDKKVMEHALFSLLSNAIKYSDESPILRLRFLQNKLNIFIADKGIGIPQNEQKSIFESYFRAKNVENHQGTGLGLIIAKEFVELHKGKLNFKSKLNQGSVFRIQIPIDTKDIE